MATEIRLGDKVRDTISGLKGVAVSRTEYLNGCIQFGVQAKATADGKIPEPQYIDEGQLVKPARRMATKPRPSRRGGPQSTPPPRSGPASLSQISKRLCAL